MKKSLRHSATHWKESVTVIYSSESLLQVRRRPHCRLRLLTGDGGDHTADCGTLHRYGWDHTADCGFSPGTEETTLQTAASHRVRRRPHCRLRDLTGTEETTLQTADCGSSPGTEETTLQTAAPHRYGGDHTADCGFSPGTEETTLQTAASHRVRRRTYCRLRDLTGYGWDHIADCGSSPVRMRPHCRLQTAASH